MRSEPEVERPAPERMWSALRRVFALARPYRGRLGLAVVLTAVGSLVWLIVPLGLRTLIDAVFEEGNRSLLDLMTIGLLVLFLVQAAVSFGGTYLLGTVGARIVTDLRRRVFDHLSRLDFGYFARQRTGELTSRLTNDVGAVREAVTHALTELLSQSLSLVGSLGLMVVLNWRLSAVVFLVVPGVTLLARKLGRAMRRFARTVQDQLADTTAIAEEAIAAIRVVKAFTREDHESGRYGDAAEALFGTERKRILVRASYSAAIGALFFSALVGIFWFGGTEVLADRLSAGDLVAFIFYAMNISRSVGGMSSLYATFSSVTGATERLFEVLDTHPEVQDRPGARPVGAVRGDVGFHGVGFAYVADRPVLHDVTFSVRAGQTVALVGPSGAGKTTLVHLIPRFYDPTEGSVTLDGVDLRDLRVESLRQRIAVVPQDLYLFNASVRENVRYGRLDADDRAIEEAVRDANAGGFVSALPDGLDTVIGERGITLSGGERQRVAIARALLRDAPLLLLDEPTSSLDSASEALIQEALDRLTAGRTTFIIAHRLSTVRHADLILVVENGRIVQSGTHDSLIAEDGLYGALAARQFRDEPAGPASAPVSEEA
jgi:subfamily B ATP-binding cassette protein MsbA